MKMKIAVVILVVLIGVCLADDCSQGFEAMFGEPSAIKELGDVWSKWHNDYNLLGIFSEKCVFEDWARNIEADISCRTGLEKIIPEDGLIFWDRFDSKVLSTICAAIFEEMRPKEKMANYLR